MSIILHIGLPKTGSTFLQDWLRLNRRLLARNGLMSPNSAVAHRIGIEAITDAETLERRDLCEIRRASSLRHAFNRLRAFGGRSIVSSEYMSAGDPVVLAEKLYENGVQVSSIICYLRRQDELCASGYAQAIKALGATRAPGDVVYTEQLDWNILHSNWAAAFPGAAISFLNYDNYRTAGTLAASFKRALGVGHLPTRDLNERANVSLSSEMTEIARLLNARGHAFRVETLLELQQRYPGPKFCFSQDMVSQFERAYIESNEIFARRFPLEFSDFGVRGWCASGVEMTGRVSAERLLELMPHIARADRWMSLSVLRRVASVAKQRLIEATNLSVARATLEHRRAQTTKG